ncbi:hypothetical protein GCM10029964_051730 [Kibdelosporangium lantanae]
MGSTPHRARDGGYTRRVKTSSQAQTLLGIYLNDHLAGAVAGTDLARRLAATENDWAGGDVLRRLADEIAADCRSLRDIMAALDVPVRRYKVVAGWAAEKVGRLKFNGRLLRRSVSSRVVELEVMRLGVEGKAAGWRTLRARAAVDSRLDAGRIDELIDRARGQIEVLEELRVRAAVDAFVA